MYSTNGRSRRQEALARFSGREHAPKGLSQAQARTLTVAEAEALAVLSLTKGPVSIRVVARELGRRATNYRSLHAVGSLLDRLVGKGEVKVITTPPLSGTGRTVRCYFLTRSVGGRGRKD